MAQMSWFSPRMVLLGVRTISDIIWGKCAPKTPKRGVNTQTSIILKLTYLGRGSSDFDEIWQSDAVWLSKKFKFRKSKMASAAILKYWKIAISRPRLERYRKRLAKWCSSTLLTVLAVEKLKFWKSKTAVAAILKNIKIAISRPRFKRFLWNLAPWHIICTLYVRTTIVIFRSFSVYILYGFLYMEGANSWGGGRFWYAACNSVNRRCSMSTYYHH